MSVIRIAGWAAAGVLAVGAAGVGIAYAASPPPSPTASSGGSAAPAAPGGPAAHGRLGRRVHRDVAGHGLLGRRVMHGEVVAKGKDGTPTTIDVQRGKVTAVSSSSITVRSDDGFTTTYAITSSTRVRINQKGATSAQISDGDTARVTARRSGDSHTAQAVVVNR